MRSPSQSGGEVLAVVFAQVPDFGGGMLVVNLPAFLAGTAIQARILWGVTHTSSFRTRWPGVWTDSRHQTTEGRSVFWMWARRSAASGCTTCGSFYSPPKRSQLNSSPHRERAETNQLGPLQQDLINLSFIEFAHWVVLPRKRLPFLGKGQFKEDLQYDYLLFFSNFNGTWNQYIDAFSAVLSQGLNLVCRFEFVQRQWIEYGNDAHLGNDKDILMGNHGGRGRFVLQGDANSANPPFICSSLPNFVEMRGGDYFFLPSIAGLGMIAMGLVDPR